jgi:hypothetical protein
MVTFRSWHSLNGSRRGSLPPTRTAANSGKAARSTDMESHRSTANRSASIAWSTPTITARYPKACRSTTTTAPAAAVAHVQRSPICGYLNRGRISWPMDLERRLDRTRRRRTVRMAIPTMRRIHGAIDRVDVIAGHAGRRRIAGVGISRPAPLGHAATGTSTRQRTHAYDQTAAGYAEPASEPASIDISGLGRG